MKIYIMGGLRTHAHDIGSSPVDTRM